MMKARTRLLAAMALAALAALPLSASAQAKKDSVVLGMVLEPHRARSDRRAGRRDRRGRALQRARRPDQDQHGRQHRAAARRKLVDRPGRPALHLQAAQGREVQRRRGLRLERRQVQLRARQGAGLDQQVEEDGVRQHQPHRDARPVHRDPGAEPGRRQLPVPHGREHRGDPRPEERADRLDQADRHRSVQVRLVGQGLVADAGEERRATATPRRSS